MKIILSPSKTQDFGQHHDAPMTLPIYEAQSIQLNNSLKRLSKANLSKLMKINGQLLDETYDNIRHFKTAAPNHALATYTGLVYKNFDMDAYKQEEFDYLNTHLNLLSAHYGILRPYDGIRPYRLDMKMKPNNKDLYKFWAKTMNDYFKDEALIIDLASNEFSKLVKANKVTVGFRDLQDGTYKNLATYAKMARGKLLHQMVLNKTTTLDGLKSIIFDGYSYNPSISKENLILFTRNVQEKCL